MRWSDMPCFSRLVAVCSRLIPVARITANVAQPAGVAGGVAVNDKREGLDDTGIGVRIDPARQIGRSDHFPAPQQFELFCHMILVQPVGDSATRSAAIECQHQARSFRGPAIDL